MGALIGGLKDPRSLIIAGDFNSQLGFIDPTTDESALIGKFVGHDLFNENGQQMRFFLNLHSFSARSTQSNPSFKTTWRCGDRYSQIDHILTHRSSFLYLNRMQCGEPQNVSTDHKILLANILENRCAVRTPYMKASASRRSDVDPSLLANTTVQKKFVENLRTYVSPPHPSGDIECTWQILKTKLNSVAATVLKRSTRLPPTRECRLALAEVKRCAFWAQRSEHPKWCYKLTEAKENLRRKIRESEENSIVEFFENLKQFPVGQRINRTHKYLKRFKKRTNNVTTSSYRNPIKLDDWIPDGSSESMIPNCSNETLDSTVVDPPTLEEIRELLARIKNGKSPGVDNVYAEFFKYCDEDTLKELHQLLVQVFTSNQLPDEWKNVVLVPIPKVSRPRSTNDYRRISLTCTAYKIYSTWLLTRLQGYVGTIGNHQAAFLPERSTSDHLHVLQRVLQESWNEGRPLVLMSLDIEKAFDRVSLLSLPSILRGLYLLSEVFVFVF